MIYTDKHAADKFGAKYKLYITYWITHNGSEAKHTRLIYKYLELFSNEHDELMQAVGALIGEHSCPIEIINHSISEI